MTAHLNSGRTICWRNLYEQDVASRGVKEVPAQPQEDVPPPEDVPTPGEPQPHNAPPTEDVPPPQPDLLRDLMAMIEAGFRENNERIGEVEEKVSRVLERVKVLEVDVKELQKNNKGKEKVVDDYPDFFYGQQGEGASAYRSETPVTEAPLQTPPPAAPLHTPAPEAPLQTPPPAAPLHTPAPEAPPRTPSPEIIYPELPVVYGPLPEGSTEPLRKIGTKYKMLARKSVPPVRRQRPPSREESVPPVRRKRPPSRYVQTPYTAGKKKKAKK